MTAAELRGYNTSGEHFTQDQLNNLIKHLTEYEKVGKRSTAVAVSAYPKSLFEHMKTLGYKVEYMSDWRDGDYYNIDWNE